MSAQPDPHSPSPAAHSAESLLKSLVDGSQDLVVALDLEGRVTFFNPAARAALRRLTGGTPAPGVSLWELLAGRPAAQSRISGLWARARGGSIEEQVLELGARVFEVRTRGVFEHGELSGVLAVLRDVTGRRRGPRRQAADADELEALVRRRTADLEAALEDYRRSEAALQQSNERFMRITDVIPTAVYICDDSACIFINQWFLDYTGLARDEVLGGGWETAVHPQDLTAVRRAWHEAMEQDSVFQIECRLRAGDGSYRWFLNRALPSVDGDGRRRSWFGVCIDIDDQKRFQSALKESEERFRGVFNNAAVGIALLDAEGRWLDLNHTFCSITGRTPVELLGLDVEAWIHPADLDLCRRQLDRLRRGEVDAFHLEHRLESAEGRERWVSLTMSRQLQGRARYIAVVQDISARKEVERQVLGYADELRRSNTDLEAYVEAHRKAERALKTSEARFRGIFENAAVGIALVDAGGGWRRVNNTLCQILGYGRAELLQTTFQAITHPDDLSIDLYQLERLQRGEIDSYAMEKRYIRRDGSPVWVNLTVSAEETAPGDQRYIAVIQDIGSKKRAEERLLEYAEELERSNADLADYAALASHDLQAPLRLMASFAELLERHYGAQLDDRARGYIQRVVENAGRMRESIRSLLGASGAMRSGSASREESGASARAAFETALSNLSSLVEQSGADIAVEDLPLVPMDSHELTRVFQNLVENAIRYRSEEPPRIRVCAEPVAEGWRLSVIDNGRGVPEESRERIFELFEHGHGAASGTGVGLAACKKIIARCGGRIWVEPVDGRGSAFRFTVPVQQGA